jgi:hypothetical protein
MLSGTRLHNEHINYVMGPDESDLELLYWRGAEISKGILTFLGALGSGVGVVACSFVSRGIVKLRVLVMTVENVSEIIEFIILYCSILLHCIVQ